MELTCLIALACEGVQTHAFAGNDGVGFFIHGPPAGHMLHLDLNYRHGQAEVSCDYVLNFQTILIGAEPVVQPPAPRHSLLVSFGYPRDPTGFQVLVWNVRDISLGFNRSLVRGLIVALNPTVVILTETRTRDLESFVPFVDSFDFGSNILRRSIPGGSARGGVWVLYREGLVTDLFLYRHRHLELSFDMSSPCHLAVFARRLEGVIPPPIRFISYTSSRILARGLLRGKYAINRGLPRAGSLNVRSSSLLGGRGALFIISAYEVGGFLVIEMRNSSFRTFSSRSSKDDTLHRFNSPNHRCASSFRVEGNARHMISSVAPAYTMAALGTEDAKVAVVMYVVMDMLGLQVIGTVSLGGAQCSRAVHSVIEWCTVSRGWCCDGTDGTCGDWTTVVGGWLCATQ
ncbi:uncharacterized protein G2W53_009633 [Senna tora]|uniref:Uncharacterized protein n=1 Tax=Senna tora TaxID=362788 RepID=A0A834WY94_9FABA|nr:uncharacterized protein G2W53_009633 [Senna tora]